MSQVHVKGAEDILRLRRAIDVLSNKFGVHTHVPGDIILANTKIIVGNSSGVGAAQTMGGDATIANDGTLTVANDVISNAKLANMATQTFKGRTTAGTGDPEDLTVAQVVAMLGATDVNALCASFMGI